MKVGGKDSGRKKSIDLSSTSYGKKQNLKTSDNEKPKLQFRRICKNISYF